MKKIISGIGLIIFIALLSGCGIPATSPANNSVAHETKTTPVFPAATTPSTNVTTTAPANPEAASHSISIQNYAFTPASLTINAGDTVTWTNDDPMPHEVSTPDFDSGLLYTGDSFSHNFTVPGTFNYICKVHPSMAGTIIVK